MPKGPFLFDSYAVFNLFRKQKVMKRLYAFLSRQTIGSGRYRQLLELTLGEEM